MRRFLFSLLFCIAISTVSLTAAFSSEDDLSGFTLKQLDTAIKKAGIATDKLYSVLTFDGEERYGANIAVLSASHSGWHITVLHRVEGALDIDWRSGNLPDDIAVSSASNLEIADVGDEQVVTFSGCAPHNCGLVDGIFGLLLYSPKMKQAFYAHYRRDDQKPFGSFGSLEFSKNALERGNERYKDALQKTMSRVLRQ